MDTEIVRKHMVLHGRVQGVGFRYRARYAAEGLGITGWVQNEWDGTVIMEAQGTEHQIAELLKLINRGNYIHIIGIETTTVAVEPDARGFHVR